MVGDSIGDYLTRLRNAIQKKQDTVSMPSSKMLVRISEILKEQGFIESFEVEQTTPQPTLNITLRYVNGESAIRELVRVSKPGIRKYRGYKEIKPIMSGMGVAIFSTPSGVVSDKTAIQNKVGGEYICYIF
jgi:small subunit ribosomal protein S8